MYSQERYIQDVSYRYTIQGESQGGYVDSSTRCFYLEESWYVTAVT